MWIKSEKGVEDALINLDLGEDGGLRQDGERVRNKNWEEDGDGRSGLNMDGYFVGKRGGSK